MSTESLQGMYVAALSRIGNARKPEAAKKYAPICQRNPAASKQRAVKDAANALSALWKMRETVKR